MRLKCEDMEEENEFREEEMIKPNPFVRSFLEFTPVLGKQYLSTYHLR